MSEDRDGTASSTAGEAGESRYLDARDGTRLHYRAWGPASPRAALLILHGLFEHSRRYQELGNAFGEEGIASFGLDLRGHGASGGRRGHVRRFDLFLDDAERFQQTVVAALPDNVPLFLLGHSMGGLVAIRYLEDRKPALNGAIITSPWLEALRKVAPWERFLAGILNRVLPIVPFPSGLKAEQISHDPERVADYRNDPEIFTTLTPRLFHEVEQAAAAAFRDVGRITPPVLFMLAGADPIINTDRSLELARSVPGTDVTIQVLEGYYHEVLSEVERASVRAEILGWIDGHMA